ncbi:MAG TPA: glycoside hydrolase family 99-like domain-containing protein [Pyrinomonadaceae bacterium]
MTGPTFRIKPYAHPKYKFVVRAKLAGKWKRSYFKSKAEAVAYAGKQNASLEKQVKRQRSGRVRSDGHTNGTRNWHELEKSNRRSTVSSRAVSRKAIVVLGMHRSGTSALCGALDVLGVNFGQRLAPATKDNKKGHWEHPEIVALHDELLRSLGSRWDNDRPLPSDWVERDITRDIRSLLIGILERDFAHASLFGLKDPRMCRLMPLWLPIFQTLRIEPHFVLTVRHPWEVAESLAKRDGLEHPKSYLLWLEHFVQAISATRAHQQSVVCYEEMIDDPVKVLSRLRKEFGVNLRAPSRLRASLRKFLEPSLRHHHLKKGQAHKHKPPVPYLALDLYETMRNASTSVEIGEKTAPLVAQFGRGSELFYPRVNLLEAELGSLDQKIAKSEKADMDSEGLVRLEIFHPVAEGYRAEESQTRYFASGCWKLLIIDLPGRERNLDRPFRIDPVSYPAVIDIAEIALKRPSTGEILWAATGSKEFAALTVGGTACRLAHESYLRILSFGNDPQLLLPQSTTALGDSPLRLELSILVDASPEAINTSLAEMQTERSQNEEHVRNIEQQKNIAEEELKQRDATIAAKNAEIERISSAFSDAQNQLNAEIERNSSALSDAQNELQKRDKSISGLNAEVQRISSAFSDAQNQLNADIERNSSALSDAQNELLKRDKSISDLNAEIQRISSALSDAQNELQKRDKSISDLNAEVQRISSAFSDAQNELKKRDKSISELNAEIERISSAFSDAQNELQIVKNAVEMKSIQEAAKNSQIAGLTAKLLNVNRDVKSFTEIFGLTRHRLQDSNSAAAVLIQSLFHDIRLIRKRKSLWKARRLVQSTLSREERHDIPSNPKIIAEALKQKLQGIQRTLKSKKTSPAMALSALTELIALQNQVHQVLASLRVWSLLRPQQKTVTARESVSYLAAAKFSTLFDAEWYLGKNPEVKKTGMDPLQHYLRYGAQEGHDPHPLFETKWYLSQAPELANISLTPLEHYVSYGAREGRSTHPEFDSQFYIKNHPESVIGEMTPLTHYLTLGWRLGYRPHPRFDPEFYLRTYPDVAAANMEPLTHFVLSGHTEGRKTTEETISFETYRLAFNIPRQPNVPADPPVAPAVRAIAFYLPQFHPIPENDRWWGKGFTDWNNVRAGQPSFPGHYQPHVPTELGYYDLRETEVLQKQTELARAYGIYGFCFYYYWFGGKVLLDLPIRRMLESGKPDFPFCICWANENWTRRWDGLEDDVLIAQSYSPEDDLNFIRRVESILLQKKYIRVRGMPLLLVYRPSLLPDSVGTTQRWRDYFRRKGHGELHLVMVRSFHDQSAPEVYGFDAAVQFPPHFPPATITTLIEGKDEKFKGTIYDYAELRRAALHQLIAASGIDKTYAAVMPSWDNTARRGSQAVMWANSSPESYYEWLRATVEQVQKKEEADERLIFINAWNEWAEGCHLEPDEKYGHAWLNATALALRTASKDLARASRGSVHPTPPKIESIKVPPLTGRLKLVISVLFYHREDLIDSFLQSLLQHILTVESREDVTCSLNLAFNYQPSLAVITEINELIVEKLPGRSDAVHILENGFNVGFGAGHNLIFDKDDSDIFLILNSDVRVIDQEWLPKLVNRFRDSDAAIVGLIQTASHLREDGCGIPIKAAGDEFDFVDGSVLAIRSDLAQRFGLFSSSFDYFYFEDVDLCLRYRQMGLRISLLDVSYEHERSSSSRLLPRFAVESVLNRNRARFFEKWGKYLRARTLSNRIGVRFLDINRHVQCASLPAIFGLLNEHKTAVIDLWGVHEQLTELFQHPRIRLVPSWQTLRENDYVRYYDLGANGSEVPRVHDIANCMGCVPDFLGVKAHLESLSESSRREDVTSPKRALLYIARKSPLFDGREPDVESFAPVAEMLRKRNFDVQLYTNYGTFEVQSLSAFQAHTWNQAELLSGLELLNEIAATDLLVTSDTWIGELGQLLQKRTFLWLGATSGRAAIWDLERASCFADQSLPCLGCFYQFGRNCHNVCLRGDIACMRPQLAKDFLASLETFLNGEPVKAAAIHPNRLDLTSHRRMPSTELLLEHWPSSTANSVLVLTPVHPSLEERVLENARALADRALKGLQDCRIVYERRGEVPKRGVPHPRRQAAIAALRQSMIERYLKDEKWVFWVDADIVDYPPNLLDELIARAEGGIAAPLVIMEGDINAPAFSSGFGPGRFYDIGGFVEGGRWARFTEPYFNQSGPVYRLDSVGSCYLVNADLYRWGARHEADVASRRFISNQSIWTEETIRQNQEATAKSYSEHYSVCQFAWRAGLPVQAFADLIAYHQKL